MTREEFDQLDTNTKFSLFQESDSLISLRDEGDCKIIIKWIDNFFVEAWYKVPTYEKIVKVVSLHTWEELKPWVFRKAKVPMKPIGG
ncbi:MAG: hypothetical protein EOO06_12415 [Chitinophagaceae bacterium]|nr:MAG: hypothetical protein EOO06_12415 [Chitinophagaceae bacterium]